MLDQSKSSNNKHFCMPTIWMFLSGLFHHQTSTLLGTFGMSWIATSMRTQSPVYPLSACTRFRGGVEKHSMANHLEAHCFDGWPLPCSDQLWWWPYMLLIFACLTAMGIYVHLYDFFSWIYMHVLWLNADTCSRFCSVGSYTLFKVIACIRALHLSFHCRISDGVLN